MRHSFIFFAFVLLLVCQHTFAQQDSGYYVSFDKVKIHYQVLGKGKPVLLLHGFTGTGSDWKNKPVTDSMLAHGYKLVLPDLRGNGSSDQPTSAAAYANDAEARDLIGLMRYLNAENYGAIGYSRGSIILARILVTDKHCTSAVIGGMGADFTNPEWPRRIGFYKALLNDTIKGYEGFRKYIAGKSLNPVVLAMQQKEQPSTSAKELASITQPVVVICGNEDQDNGKGTELSALISNSKFIEVRGNHNNSAWTTGFAENVLNFFNNNNPSK